MTAFGYLGLVLCSTRTKGAAFVLFMIIGITGSVRSLFLHFGGLILLKVRKQDPLVKIKIPTTAEVYKCNISFSTEF